MDSGSQNHEPETSHDAPDQDLERAFEPGQQLAGTAIGEGPNHRAPEKNSSANPARKSESGRCPHVLQNCRTQGILGKMPDDGGKDRPPGEGPGEDRAGVLLHGEEGPFARAEGLVGNRGKHHHPQNHRERGHPDEAIPEGGAGKEHGGCGASPKGEGALQISGSALLQKGNPTSPSRKRFLGLQPSRFPSQGFAVGRVHGGKPLKGFRR